MSQVSTTQLAEIAEFLRNESLGRDYVVKLRKGSLETLVPVTMKITTKHPVIEPNGHDSDYRKPIEHNISFVVDKEWPYAYSDNPIFKEKEPLNALWAEFGLQADHDGNLVIAKVFIEEIAGHIHAPFSWFESLDPQSSDLATLGHWLDSTAERAFSMLDNAEPTNLSGGGSIFYCQSVCVTPSAQGQQLGLHLLGRALKYLGRSPNDIAVLKPIAIPNALDSTIDLEAAEETWTLSFTPGLADYYAQLGFRLDEEYAERSDEHFMFVAFNLWLRHNGSFWTIRLFDEDGENWEG